MKHATDITELAREVARQICVSIGEAPDARDSTGRYNWEWFIGDARRIIQLIRSFEL